MKNKVIVLSSIFVLILTIALNIVLLTTPIFKGTYTYEKNNQIKKIVFYDNTYSFDFDFGFYEYVSKNSNENIDYNLVVFNSCKNNNSFSYRRNSVFTLTKTLNNNKVEKYTCYTAIFLHIIYVYLSIASIVVILKKIPKKNQSNDLKNE